MTRAARHPDGFIDRGAQVTRLEAFVDAAFAFALTMLVISIDQIPENRAELVDALKGIPAFAVSFAVLAMFWWEHNRWSRRFGLDDGWSVLISLVYVFLALVYIYPLKVLFSAMFGWLSNGWLPSDYAIEELVDLQFMYQVYAVAFASMGLINLGLNLRAWRLRERIGLDALERLALKRVLLADCTLPAMALLSFSLATGLAIGAPDIVFALPGMVYAGLSLQFLVHLYGRAEEARLRAELAGLSSEGSGGAGNGELA
jgi:uncharacterized membrane protein